jgi:signal transduction histidine kinase
VRYPEESWPQSLADAIHDGPMQTIVSVALELDALAKAIVSDDPPSTDDIRGSLWQFRAANQDAAKDLRLIVRRLSERAGPNDPEDEGSAVERQLAAP